MKIYPKSFQGWFLFFVTIIIIVSQFFAYYVYSKERQKTIQAIGGDEIARIVFTSVAFLEKIPSKERSFFLTRINYPNMNVSISDDFITVDAFKNQITDIIKQSITDKFSVKKEIIVEAFLASNNNNIATKLLRASVKLDDGNWFNLFAPFTDYEVGFLSFPYILSVILFSLFLLLLSGLGVLMATKPLKTFSKIAQNLGHNINAEPVLEEGLLEVRELAKAFNEMQKKLKDLIENRTQFLGAISHDLRTPITRLKIRAEFIDNEEIKAKTIKDLDEMEKMISSAMVFAKMGVIGEVKEKINVPKFISEICGELQEAGLNVTYYKEADFTANVCPLSIKRAVINLVENAVRYGKKACVYVNKTNHYFSIAITDEGLGIPEDEMDKVLLPFYRIDAARSFDTGGIGLGLSVVMSVVDIHGGHLEFVNLKQNNTIKGLKVIMTIPC